MPLALMLIAAFQSPAVSAAPPAEEPIVVVASRLDAVRFNLSVNRLTGAMRCTVARSSGDAAIDSYMCDVARHCARTSRKVAAEIERCIKARKADYLARYAPRASIKP
jgi:hypothetical protein